MSIQLQSVISAPPASSFDFTIVGAGASGLWLALALFEEGLLENLTLCIVESDASKHNDRTWCYWEVASPQPNVMVSKSWNSIYNPHNLLSRNDLLPYSYYHIRSADFYKSIKQQLATCANITWYTLTVAEIEVQSHRVLVKTVDTSWYSSQVFLSTQLPVRGQNLTDGLSDFLSQKERKKNAPFLWQSFVGWRLQTSSPIFDDTCATLMCFDIPQQNSTQFIYELPFSASEALIEITRFGQNQLTYQEAEILLREFLEKKNIDFNILEKEHGNIPMTAQFDVRRKYLEAETRVIYIGTLGGAIKPTTGYGFKRMQNYGKALAKALREQKPLPTMRRLNRFRFYDHLLLRILYSSPHRGKAVFQRLFETQPITRVLRFLDEETTILEEILIFLRLPIRLFLRSLLSYCFN